MKQNLIAQKEERKLGKAIAMVSRGQLLKTTVGVLDNGEQRTKEPETLQKVGGFYSEATEDVSPAPSAG